MRIGARRDFLNSPEDVAASRLVSDIAAAEHANTVYFVAIVISKGDVGLRASGQMPDFAPEQIRFERAVISVKSLYAGLAESFIGGFFRRKEFPERRVDFFLF